MCKAVQEPKYRYADTGNEVKEGARYWYIGSAGGRCSSQWNKLQSEIGHYDMGNCFETEEGAKKRLAYLKARKVILDFIRDNGGMANDGGIEDRGTYYFAEYNNEKKKLGVDEYSYFTITEYRFASEEACEKCISEHPEELLSSKGI